jgi:polyisoprenoid-binding protein YceI
VATRTTSLIPTGTWSVDAAHSSVEFGIKHMGIATVRGKFTEFEGTLGVGEDLASSYPEITFESTRVEVIDDESSHVVGNLTMHGITREVKLKAVFQGTEVDPWGNDRVGLEVVGVLKRSDFDMKFNQALGSGNMLVGDNVNVSLDISAVKQP